MTLLDRPLTFAVPGHPRPKGSLKCVGMRGRHHLVDDNPETRKWLNLIADHARRLNLEIDTTQAVGVDLTAILPRPAYHRGARQTLLKRAPTYPVSRRTGDIDKLARTVLDALQASGLLGDDAQVIELTARKHYGPDDHLGVVIRIYPVGPP